MNTTIKHIHVSVASNWTSGLRWSRISVITEQAEALGVSPEEILQDLFEDTEDEGEVLPEDYEPRAGFVPKKLEDDRDALLDRGEGHAFLPEEVLVVYDPGQWPGGHILARQGQLFLLGVGYPEEDENGGDFWPPPQRRWVWIA